MAGVEIDGANNKIELNTGAAAADQHILFNGNAQDFYIALDDSADDLLIGLGSTVGTTPIISVDENKDVAIPDGGLTITTADNSDNLTLTSTDADANAGPNLLLDRNSSSTANQDILGTITFRGRNDAGQDVDYIKLEAVIADETDGTEDGNFHISNITAGTARKYISVNRADITINEDSQDIDFRVESNTLDDAFMVNGGTDSVLIGCQEPPSSSVGGVGFTKSTNSRMEGTFATTSTSSNGLLGFVNPNGDVGSIATSGSATAFNTSSDYRLKENVNYSFDATTELKKLKPAKFNFKTDSGTTVEGFLAHEVADVVPVAVTGEKDAVDDDGEIVAQGIDQSKLVPLMVKTIQELEARIKTLEDA